MDDQWERAIAAALGGQTESRSVRTLNLDSAVKCMHGQLPPPPILERFVYLQHLSLANIGAASLKFFPRLSNLQSLILSDNRIAGGLEYLVLAKLDSLRDLDLSNNRIQSTHDLSPLSRLKLVSLDLYECPVTRENGYRSSVFGSIKSLKYLDKGDAEGNERPESDEEEEDDDDDDEDYEYDPGSGEIDGEDRPHVNGSGVASEGVLDADEDEESDADEEVDLSRMANGLHDQINGGGAGIVVGRGEEYDEGDDDDESVDEIDEEDDAEAVRGGNHSDEDAVEEEDEDDEDDDEDDEDVEDEEEEVDNELENTERIIEAGLAIDVNKAEEVDLGDFEDEEDEEGSEEGYLVRAVRPQCNGINEVDSEEEEVEDGGVRGEERGKRKREGEDDEEEDVDEEEESDEDDE